MPKLPERPSRSGSASFEARYGGDCGVCDQRIESGDEVVYFDDVLQHVTCPTGVRTVLGSLCPHCQLIHPGEC